MSDAYFFALGCLGNIFRITAILSFFGFMGWVFLKLTGIRIGK